jgi:hypothetical protein
VLRHFNDISKLLRLTTGPLRNDGDNDFNVLNEQWHKEMEAVIQNNNSITFAPTNDERKKVSEYAEDMLDNTAYQPMGYNRACTFLVLILNFRDLKQ